MAFLESPAFPGCPSFGFTSRPVYTVSVARMRSGVEKRNRESERPLHEYTVAVDPRAEDEIQEALEYWHALGGWDCGFRFKDHADFKSCRVGQQASRVDQPLVFRSGAIYQLTKRYVAGARVQLREIVKPVQGSILVADAGVPKTEGVHYTLDYATGLLTVLFIPQGALTWGGEFDVPVRFSSEFPVEIINQRIQGVNFTLLELRNPS